MRWHVSARPVHQIAGRRRRRPVGRLAIRVFFGYLHDQEKNAHDQETWFGRGDISRQDSCFYSIIRRASVDIIKPGGYKISALEHERECLNILDVVEAMVADMENEGCRQLVATLVAAKSSPKEEAAGLTLGQLRSDLRANLAGYKRPVVVKVEERETSEERCWQGPEESSRPSILPSLVRNNA